MTSRPRRRACDDECSGVAQRELDTAQASLLVQALAQTHRQSDLSIAFREAWERGEAWREVITRGMAYLKPEAADRLRHVVAPGLSQIGETVADLEGFAPTPPIPPGL